MLSTKVGLLPAHPGFFPFGHGPGRERGTSSRLFHEEISALKSSELPLPPGLGKRR